MTRARPDAIPLPVTPAVPPFAASILEITGVANLFVRPLRRADSARATASAVA